MLALAAGRRLQELHLADNTIVVFTSDNGGVVHVGKPPNTSNLPLRNGKGTAYEGGLRVPLIVKAPGVTRPGMLRDVPVIKTDFFPSLLELPRGALQLENGCIGNERSVGNANGETQ